MRGGLKGQLRNSCVVWLMCSYYSGKPKSCCGWCPRSGSSILILWYMLLHPGDPHGWIADWVCWNGVVTFGSFATAQGKVIEDHKYVQKEAQKNGEWLKQKACLFFNAGVCLFFLIDLCWSLCDWEKTDFLSPVYLSRLCFFIHCDIACIPCIPCTSWVG